MKILVITAIYPSAGAPEIGTFVQTQVESLRKAGVEVDVLVLSGRPRKLIYPKGVWELRQRLRHSSIDLIHAHVSYAGMVARTQWKVPVVVTYHGSDVLGAVNARGRISWLSKISVAATAYLSRYVDAVIVQSSEMASRLGSAQHLHVVPCEVDFELFCPQPREDACAALNLDPSKKYLLFAANPNIPVKRFPLASSVADCLRRRDPSIELLVVFREPQSRLPLYMNACDALIFPSYQEGSPNLVKQAMACNLPVVATDVGDVRELIGKTVGCYICQPEVEEFTNRLYQILQSGQRTDGRNQVRHLNRSLTAGKLIRVYQEVLTEKPCPGQSLVRPLNPLRKPK